MCHNGTVCHCGVAPPHAMMYCTPEYNGILGEDIEPHEMVNNAPEYNGILGGDIEKAKEMKTHLHTPAGVLVAD